MPIVSVRFESLFPILINIQEKSIDDVLYMKYEETSSFFALFVKGLDYIVDQYCMFFYPNEH